MKKTISLILSFVIFINICAYNLTEARAVSYYARYEGTLTSLFGSGTCIFTVYELNDNTFSGHIYNSSSPNLNMDVSGTLYKHNSSYECVFSATSSYSFDITVYPYEGRANCIAGGGVILHDEFTMYGTMDTLYNAVNLDINDLKM